MDVAYKKEVVTKIGAKRIDLLPFCQQLAIVLPKENERLNKLWDDIPEFVGAVTHNYLTTAGDIVIRFNQTPILAKHILHETNHAATMLLSHVGQEFDGEASEILAYLQMYMFDEIVKLCKKKKLTIKL